MVFAEMAIACKDLCSTINPLPADMYGIVEESQNTFLQSKSTYRYFDACVQQPVTTPKTIWIESRT